MAQIVKTLPATWETQVRSLGPEDPLRRALLLMPVFLPGEFHGQSSLMGYGPGSRKESDTADQLTLSVLAEGFTYMFSSTVYTI